MVLDLNLAPLYPSCVILGRLVKLPKLQISYLQMKLMSTSQGMRVTESSLDSVQHIAGSRYMVILLLPSPKEQDICMLLA